MYQIYSEDGNNDFNPHARVGRDARKLGSFGSHLHFNPHARVGRDMQAHISLTLTVTFQSTRPRGA